MSFLPVLAQLSITFRLFTLRPPIAGLTSIRLGQSLWQHSCRRSFPRLIPAHLGGTKPCGFLYGAAQTSYTARRYAQCPYFAPISIQIFLFVAIAEKSLDPVPMNCSKANPSKNWSPITPTASPSTQYPIKSSSPGPARTKAPPGNLAYLLGK
ncbi:hypothetical protein Holit_03022 [Hollandina sp. SP2]